MDQENAGSNEKSSSEAKAVPAAAPVSAAVASAVTKKEAYDVKELFARLKGRGLDILEQDAQILAEETLGWLKESVTLSKNPYDDMALMVLPQLEKNLKKQIDKINGKVDIKE